MNNIDNIFAVESQDSRGNPTLNVTVTSGEFSDSFSVPSGASTGIHEAHELRDLDGKGVQKALEGIKTIITPALIGQNIFDQKNIDELLCALDGTLQKDQLGANAIIGVSIAVAKTASKVKGLEVHQYLKTLADIKSSREVPYLYMNLINGGKHAHNGLAFQEYHIVPQTQDVAEAVEIGTQIQEKLKTICDQELGIGMYAIGDEGGIAPKLSDVVEPLKYLNKAIEELGLKDKVKLALDVAASSFFENGFYLVNNQKLRTEEFLDIYKEIVSDFDILSIEDPFNEEAFEDFHNFKKEFNIGVIGDDLTVTNVEHLKQALEADSITGMIIKPNQIGTLSETLATMKLARESGIELIVSHRSGETNDDFIADLAYAFGCYGLKAGSPCKSERLVKYQRLLNITKS